MPSAAFFLGVIVLASIADGYVMATYFNADLPYWDATTTVLALTAQYLIARKILESWCLWIVVDWLSLGVLNYKGLHGVMSQYAVFLMLATAGLWEWRKSYLEQASD